MFPEGHPVGVFASDPPSPSRPPSPGNETLRRRRSLTPLPPVSTSSVHSSSSLPPSAPLSSRKRRHKLGRVCGCRNRFGNLGFGPLKRVFKGKTFDVPLVKIKG